MYFHRTRRTCVLISAIWITLPLYLLIFLFHKTYLPEFNRKRKLEINNLANSTYDSVPFTLDTPPYYNGEPTTREPFLGLTDEDINRLDESFDENVFAVTVDISKGELLQDVDTADVVPHRDLSAKQIFFVETSHPEGGFLEINAREACAIESAAKMHPDYNIYVLFVGRIAIDPNGNCTKMVRNLIKANPNVYFRRIDIEQFSKTTPMEKFFESGRYKNSKHLSVHLADILRLVALWRYGGLYFDLDVVVIRNHKELGENFLAATTNIMLMSGTMQFSGNGVGHVFVDECLKDLDKHFRGGSWGGNGPDLVTRQMKKFCGTRNTTEMTEERCQGMKVLDKSLFLPIWYPSHKLYFAPSFAKRIASLVESKSFTAHIFNHMNHHFKLFKGGKAAYLTLAESYCPVVYGTLDTGDPF